MALPQDFHCFCCRVECTACVPQLGRSLGTGTRGSFRLQVQNPNLIREDFLVSVHYTHIERSTGSAAYWATADAFRLLSRTFRPKARKLGTGLVFQLSFGPCFAKEPEVRKERLEPASVPGSTNVILKLRQPMEYSTTCSETGCRNGQNLSRGLKHKGQPS